MRLLDLYNEIKLNAIKNNTNMITGLQDREREIEKEVKSINLDVYEFYKNNIER